MAVTRTLDGVFPTLLARHLAEDSEGLLLALLLPLWIQYARPRLTGSTREWPVTLLAAAACLAVGVGLRGGSGLPATVVTLNETFWALAVLLPYVQLRRPLPRAVVLGLAAGVLLLVAVGSRTAFVTDLAEGFAMLVLAPVGLDVVDRAILDRRGRTSEAARWSWYAFLLGAPAGLSLLHGALGGVAGEAIRYGVRVQEAFLGVLLVELYLVAVLRRAGVGPGWRRSQRAPETQAS